MSDPSRGRGWCSRAPASFCGAALGGCDPAAPAAQRRLSSSPSCGRGGDRAEASLFAALDGLKPAARLIGIVGGGRETGRPSPSVRVGRGVAETPWRWRPPSRVFRAIAARPPGVLQGTAGARARGSIAARATGPAAGGNFCGSQKW